jgi:CAAX prenyl protease-like protein
MNPNIINEIKSKPWIPYVVPFGIYMLSLMFQSDRNLWWFYPLKISLVAAALWYFRKDYPELRWPSARSWAFAVVVGLVAIVIWIAIDPFYPGISQITTAKTPKPFDPHTLPSVAGMWAFISVRTLGAVLIVPVMEELFWRAFMIRWLVKEDFKSVPLGVYTFQSFAWTVVLFGLEHDQWLAGLICGALYNWLFYKCKDVTACVVAHAVSNAALAAWVLMRGDWKFW